MASAKQALSDSVARHEQIAAEILALCEEWVERAQPSPPEQPALDDRGVFVVGSARSGTTILANCLNLSPEVFLLGEPDLFLNHARPDFVEFFNGRHQRYGNLWHKGLYAPPAKVPERDAFALLRRMTNWHRYVGEKLALGPRPHALGDDWPRKCFDFYATHFYGSYYFLLLRPPAEVVFSMRRMWPCCTVPHLLECWILTTRFLLDLYLAFEKSHVIFFDRLSPHVVDRAAEILHVPIEVPEGMISRRYQSSSSASQRLPDFLETYSEVVEGCQAIYERLRDNFGCESFRYEGSENISSFFNGTRNLLNQLLQALEPELSRQAKAA